MFFKFLGVVSLVVFAMGSMACGLEPPLIHCREIGNFIARNFPNAKWGTTRDYYELWKVEDVKKIIEEVFSSSPCKDIFVIIGRIRETSILPIGIGWDVVRQKYVLVGIGRQDGNLKLICFDPEEGLFIQPNLLSLVIF
jgi:hypothetical protein